MSAILETGRLILRPPRAEDVPRFVALDRVAYKTRKNGS